MTITTTVTWQDLHAAAESELSDLRDAFEEITEQAREDFGDDWQDAVLPSDPDAVDEDRVQLWVYQQQAQQYDTAAKSIQKRLHLLDTLKDEYGDGDFAIKMLSGEETMQIETELRMLAQQP